MLWLAIVAWLIGVAQGFINEKRKLAINILILGIIDLVGIFYFGLGWIGLSVLALLAVIILVVNKIGS